MSLLNVVTCENASEAGNESDPVNGYFVFVLNSLSGMGWHLVAAEAPESTTALRSQIEGVKRRMRELGESQEEKRERSEGEPPMPPAP